MNLKDMRIAYVPLSPDCAHPGDSRRFSRYAQARGLSIEIADPAEDYDLVVISQGADLSIWSQYARGRARIVYDFTDSYLAIPRWNTKGMLRGFAKYVTGQSRHLRFNHWRAIEDMCKRSNAVVCVTEEQRRAISEHCPNVHIILDIHAMYRGNKKEYASGEVFNLVWEGYPQNLLAFYRIRDALREIDSKHPLALHLLTSLEFGRFMGSYLKRRSSDIARDILPRSYLYEWNEQLCSQIISACDMAIIPIDLDDPLTLGKPENKLLIFWRVGMPAIVSATPAYGRAMQGAGLRMACRTTREWLEILEQYVMDAAARKVAGQRGKDYAETHFGEDHILAQWDALFASLVQLEL